MHIKPKKRLGQNFLVDKNIQRKIVEACAFQPSDIILEIGAGRGELTKLIAEKAKAVFALEIDASLCDILKTRLKEYKNIKVIKQDILKFNFKGLPPGVQVLGNIPYYITTPILERLFKYREKIKTIFISVQKEFAQRIIAPPGTKDYGAFSCFMQYYTDPKKLFYIKRTCFYPAPKVDSCFLHLAMREKPKVLAKNETLLFKIIRAAFNQRRKILKNSLQKVLPRRKIEFFLNHYSLNQNIRAEQLSLEDFAHLADTIN